MRSGKINLGFSLLIRILIALFIFINIQSFGQDLIYTYRPVRLNVNQHLPKDLLSTKTIVIVDAGEKSTNWKKISEDAHAQLKRSGIDAVGYFLASDLFSGIGTQKETAKFFTSRGISNLIFISKRAATAEVWLTPFNSQWDFVTMDQSAWYSKDSTVSKALLPLYQRSALELDRKNMLILDYPEFYDGHSFYKKEVRKSYPPDLKSFKAGIVLRKNEPVIEKGSANDLEIIRRYEDEVSASNSRLIEIMDSNYPFKYDTVDVKLSHDELRNEFGIQFLIYYVHTGHTNAREILNFPVNAQAKEYPSNGFLTSKPLIINIPVDRPVYKFYIVHLATGTLYSGSAWDADTLLEDALLNFINNMKRDFKINP